MQNTKTPQRGFKKKKIASKQNRGNRKNQNEQRKPLNRIKCFMEGT